jgi:putative SOS response-associated peptidase YedK
MCYQTRLIKKKEEIQNRFQVELDDLMRIEDFELNKGFDYPKTPIITQKQPNKISLYNWGLIPTWANDTSFRHYTLNARIETLEEKPSFKDVIQNRCLIIADGFYEWQWLTKSGNRKQKYLITLPKEELFTFAGLYAQWTDLNGKVLNSYTMVTTQANELMCEIHNTKQRMPIILKPADEKYWLNGENYKDFQFPYSNNLVAHPENLNPSSQLNLF